MPSQPTDAAVALSPIQAKMALEVCSAWLALFADTPGLKKYERYNYGPAVELLRDELEDLIRTAETRSPARKGGDATRAQAPAAGDAVDSFCQAMQSARGYLPLRTSSGALQNLEDINRFDGWCLAMTGGLAGGGGS